MQSVLRFDRSSAPSTWLQLQRVDDIPLTQGREVPAWRLQLRLHRCIPEPATKSSVFSGCLFLALFSLDLTHNLCTDAYDIGNLWVSTAIKGFSFCILDNSIPAYIEVAPANSTIFIQEFAQNPPIPSEWLQFPTECHCNAEEAVKKPKRASLLRRFQTEFSAFSAE